MAAVASHTGALAGSDVVFDAAIRRAGMLRVDTLGELFMAAETLARFEANRDTALVDSRLRLHLLCAGIRHLPGLNRQLPNRRLTPPRIWANLSHSALNL